MLHEKVILIIYSINIFLICSSFAILTTLSYKFAKENNINNIEFILLLTSLIIDFLLFILITCLYSKALDFIRTMNLSSLNIAKLSGDSGYLAEI